MKKCSLVTSSMMALVKGFDLFEIKCLAEMGWLMAFRPPSRPHFDFFILAELKAPGIERGFRDLI